MTTIFSPTHNHYWNRMCDTHSASAIVLTGIGVTVIDVGLAGVPCEACNTCTGEAVYQILQGRTSNTSISGHVSCQKTFTDCLSPSTRLLGSDVYSTVLQLTVQVPPFWQGLEVQSSMFISQVLPVHPATHVHE